MIFIKKITKEGWEMTAKEAKELSKELNYIAEEANDHERTHYTQLILEGNIDKFKNINFRISAIPDEEGK